MVNSVEATAAAGSSAYERPVQDVYMTATDTLSALLRGTSYIIGASSLLGGLSAYTNTKDETSKVVCSHIPLSTHDGLTVVL